MPLGLGQPPAETWHRVRSDSRRLAHGRDPVQIAEYGRRRRDHGRRDLGAICPDCPDRSRPDAESDGSRPDAGTATAVWDAERRPCSVSWIDRPCCNDQFSDAVTARGRALADKPGRERATRPTNPRMLRRPRPSRRPTRWIGGGWLHAARGTPALQRSRGHTGRTLARRSVPACSVRRALGCRPRG